MSTEPEVCDWCEGKPLPDRDYEDRYGVVWSVPSDCPECGMTAAEHERRAKDARRKFA